MRLPQELASSFGQLWIHEHELGRERPFEGVLIDETNRRSFRSYVSSPCEEFPACALSVRPPQPEHAPLE